MKLQGSASLSVETASGIVACGPLGRESRLQLAREFKRTMKKQRHGNAHFVLFAAPTPPGAAAAETTTAAKTAANDSDFVAAPSRLGLAVARTAGHAPARARLRRLMREAFRCIRPELRGPTDLVALVRQPWPEANLASVVQQMRISAQAMRLLQTGRRLEN